MTISSNGTAYTLHSERSLQEFLALWWELQNFRAYERHTIAA